MTVEQKIKAYDEAIKRAIKHHDNDGLTLEQYKTIDIIFPELKESEDEMIRKMLIRHIAQERGSLSNDEAQMAIDWLKKQEKKESDPRYEDLEDLLAADDIYQMAMNDKMVQEAKEKAKDALSKLQVSKLLNIGEKPYTFKSIPRLLEMIVPCDRAKSYCQKLIDTLKQEGYDADAKIATDYLKEMNGEKVAMAVQDSYCQENCKGFQETGKCFADGDCVAKKEVTPKFKVGDWIVRGDTIAQILDIQEQYYVGLDINGKDFTSSRFLDDNKIHLWSIEDAKDGDVLAAQECYVIFKEIDGLNIKCYCTYHYMGFNPSFSIDTLQNKTAFHPATKEQCDILMKAMADAGYTFDFENKELKELKKIEFNPDDLIEESYQQQADDLIDMVIENPAWSKEDEHRAKDTIYFLDTAKKHYASTVELDACIEWLKLLKQRIEG